MKEKDSAKPNQSHPAIRLSIFFFPLNVISLRIFFSFFLHPFRLFVSFFLGQTRRDSMLPTQTENSFWSQKEVKRNFLFSKFMLSSPISWKFVHTFAFLFTCFLPASLSPSCFSLSPSPDHFSTRQASRAHRCLIRFCQHAREGSPVSETSCRPSTWGDQEASALVGNDKGCFRSLGRRVHQRIPTTRAVWYHRRCQLSVFFFLFFFRSLCYPFSFSFLALLCHRHGYSGFTSFGVRQSCQLHQRQKQWWNQEAFSRRQSWKDWCCCTCWRKEVILNNSYKKISFFHQLLNSRIILQDRSVFADFRCVRSVPSLFVSLFLSSSFSSASLVFHLVRFSAYFHEQSCQSHLIF